MLKLHLAAIATAVIAGITAWPAAASVPILKPTLPVQIAEAEVALWTCQDMIPIPRTKYSASPWNLPKSKEYRKWTLQLWQQRGAACLIVLHERARQWNWRAFLTPVERAVLMCETQMNWRHNSGTYQGAPGFYRGSWDAFRPAGFPSEAYNATPWQQTVVMRLIRARYGWSGWGCYTHGGYRSHL